MKLRTFLVLFLVCILVMDAVVARRCGGSRRRKVIKIVRRLKPLVKVIRIIKKIRHRAPCNEGENAVLRQPPGKSRICPSSTAVCRRNCAKKGMRGKCHQRDCQCY